MNDDSDNERTADGDPLHETGMHDAEKNRATPPKPRPPDDENQPDPPVDETD